MALGRAVTPPRTTAGSKAKQGECLAPKRLDSRRLVGEAAIAGIFAVLALNPPAAAPANPASGR